MKNSLFIFVIVSSALLVPTRSLADVFRYNSPFDFPSVHDETVTFYNEEYGELQTFGSKNSVLSMEKTADLGGFIHKFLWSPDGNYALVLAENVFPALRSLLFASLEREVGSLNWWLYNVNNSSAEVLPNDIVSAGWIFNETIIYNKGNDALMTANINEVASGKYALLVPTLEDKNDISDTPYPVSAHSSTIFPMQKGFFFIDTNDEIYYSLTGSVQKIVPDILTDDFLIQSGGTLKQFSPQTKTTRVLDSNFSFSDFTPFEKDTFAIIDNNKVFLYNTKNKTKEEISTISDGDAMRVFSLGERDIVITTTESVYRKTLAPDPIFLLGENSEITVDGITTPTPSPKDAPIQSPQESSSISVFTRIAFIIFILGLTTVVGVFIARRRKKSP